MAAQRRTSRSSQSSSFPRESESSSPWHTRDSLLSGADSPSSDFKNTRAWRAGVIDLTEDGTKNARRRGCDYDDMDAELERPRKRSKTSPTQSGRGIRKIVDLYNDLTVLLSQAKKHRAVKALGRERAEELERRDFVGMTEEEIEDERKDRKRCHTALRLLNDLLPGFEQRAAAADNLSHFCAPFQTDANNARSDDSSRLKIAVAEWLNSRPGSITSSYLSANGKHERGINHDITGNLLCPIDYDWNDPCVRAKLRNAEPGYDFTSSFFLRCLYEDESGDPDSPHIGFLKGPLLLRAYRHIFTSPSSASTEERSEKTSRRRDVATSLGLNGRVTPRSIAYAATQLIFSMNSARSWKREYEGFHYPTFYNFIVDFLEDSEDEGATKVVNELLQWWKNKIFPSTRGQSLPNAFKSSRRMLQESRASAMADYKDNMAVLELLFE